MFLAKNKVSQKIRNIILIYKYIKSTENLRKRNNSVAFSECMTYLCREVVE